MINTEKRNENSINIDKMSSIQMMRVMQEENYNAVRALETELPAISEAVDKISDRMKRGGRILYIGCGTSGRLGVVDAAECPQPMAFPLTRLLALSPADINAFMMPQKAAKMTSSEATKILPPSTLTKTIPSLEFRFRAALPMFAEP